MRAFGQSASHIPSFPSMYVYVWKTVQEMKSRKKCTNLKLVGTPDDSILQVCGKRLPPSGNTDCLCKEHRFEEGDVLVLEYDLDEDFYAWRPKIPARTVGNGIKPKKGAVKNE
ncbi:hypothetical protein IBX38_03855 [Candidatus Bathyarchaeota archaeon]|nr:hypothetical protein [Candidatus Bathyarchaeota archaeon]